MSGLCKLMFAGGNPQLLVEMATMSLPILMQLNKLVLTRSNLSVCQLCRILTQLIVIIYIMLCWMLYFVCCKSVFFKSPFSWKSACFEYVPVLDPTLPRSTHDCFTWIDNSILILCRITYSILAHFILFIYPLSHLLSILLISFRLLHFYTSYLLSIQYLR